MNVKFIELVDNFLFEFKDDLKKQCLVLMGLPASGKSTFINNDLHKILPAFKRYKVINSDNQVRRLQYQTAVDHFAWLKKNVKDKIDILKFKADTTYVDNKFKERVIPITYEWWMANESKGIKNYFKVFYKLFYATYFDIRDLAKVIDKQLWQTKVIEAGNILIIDTVAAKHKKILDRLTDAKAEGFNTTIVYLEITPELCIERDKFRENMEGRGVSASVINGYAKNMGTAYSAYQSEGTSQDSVVDRLMKFEWKPTGNSVIKGTWSKIEDNRYALKKKTLGLKNTKERG